MHCSVLKCKIKQTQGSDSHTKLSDKQSSDNSVLPNEGVFTNQIRPIRSTAWSTFLLVCDRISQFCRYHSLNNVYACLQFNDIPWLFFLSLNRKCSIINIISDWYLYYVEKLRRNCTDQCRNLCHLQICHWYITDDIKLIPREHVISLYKFTYFALAIYKHGFEWWINNLSWSFS